MKQKFEITGMSCAACAAKVERSAGALDGVGEASVNLLSGTLLAEFDESRVSAQAIVQAVEKAGYGAKIPGKEGSREKEKPREAQTDELLRSMKRRLIFSACILIPLMYLSMGHMIGLPMPFFFEGYGGLVSAAMAQFILTLLVMLINRNYYTSGIRALIGRSPNMDSLIAVGSLAAVLHGIVSICMMGYDLGNGQPGHAMELRHSLYFESAAMILTLVTVGKYLETRSKRKTTDAISKLQDLSPRTAVVIRDGKEQEIPAEALKNGDRILVKPGQRVPADGVLISGNGVLDESALTGESIPVERAAGERVSAASMNLNGSFVMQAEKVGEETLLSQIIRLVEDANTKKAPIAKLADRIAGVFVPVVMTLALLTTIVWTIVGPSFGNALSFGIAVLVISCPCALGLATPVAIMVGTGKGAENGILIKSGEALEQLQEVKTVVLDKTGTITEGKPKVTDVIPLQPGLTESDFLSAAAALEAASEHPLAQAVVLAAKQRGLSLPNAEQFQAVFGKGIRAVIEGRVYLAGNVKLLEENEVDLSETSQKAEELAGEGKTPLLFAADGKIMGIIAVADTIKPASRQAVRELEQMGISVVMLTGDNARTAEAIRKQAGIRTAKAEVLPQEKEAVIRQIRETSGKTAMIGDGINDAPALASADVGIAIGAGTDIAMDSADMILMKSDLMDAVGAVRLSRAVIRNIKENLFWAFFYNSIGIPLAAGVFYPLLHWKLNPMFGAAAMSLSSVCVVTNALRLRRVKLREKENIVLPAETAQKAAAGNYKDKGEKNMKKVMKINGMMCGHCKMSAEKALNAIEGVTAEVDLAAGCAMLILKQDVADEVLAAAITEAGFEPGEIRNA